MHAGSAADDDTMGQHERSCAAARGVDERSDSQDWSSGVVSIRAAQPV